MSVGGVSRPSSMEGQSVQAFFLFLFALFCKLPDGVSMWPRVIAVYCALGDSYTRHLLLHVGWDSATRHKKVSLKYVVQKEYQLM
jgi:hypothetical protein